MGFCSSLCWTVLLFTAAIVSAMQSESIFNEDSQMEEETGIIDLSSSGRTDVRTNLYLSPWELFVLGDLVFKVATKQCPKMNKDALTALKDLLADSFKQAPMVEIQNEQFLPSYSHLVRCIDYLDASPEDQEKATKAEAVIDTIEKSEESDWTAKDALITEATTTEALSNGQEGEEENELGSSWLWGFRSIHQWLRNLFKLRPDKNAVAEDDQEKEIIRQRENARKREQHRRVDIAYRRSRQNFANFFHEMSKVIRKTCPIIHRPDKIFMRNALMDMATWATLEPRDTISTATQYFRKHELLKLLQECIKSL